MLLICNFSVAVKFHIAHLYEVQGKYRLAKENYETLLKEKALPSHLKADICRQLGEYLKNSIQNDSHMGRKVFAFRAQCVKIRNLAYSNVKYTLRMTLSYMHCVHKLKSSSPPLVYMHTKNVNFTHRYCNTHIISVEFRPKVNVYVLCMHKNSFSTE